MRELKPLKYLGESIEIYNQRLKYILHLERLKRGQTITDRIDDDDYSQGIQEILGPDLVLQLIKENRDFINSTKKEQRICLGAFTIERKQKRKQQLNLR